PFHLPKALRQRNRSNNRPSVTDEFGDVGHGNKGIDECASCAQLRVSCAGGRTDETELRGKCGGLINGREPSGSRPCAAHVRAESDQGSQSDSRDEYAAEGDGQLRAAAHTRLPSPEENLPAGREDGLHSRPAWSADNASGGSYSGVAAFHGGAAR